MFLLIDHSNEASREGVAFPPKIACDACMDQFIAKHADNLQGVLSCFDRVLFRGYLPFFSSWAMASFLEARRVHRRDVKRFVLGPGVSAQGPRAAEGGARGPALSVLRGTREEGRPGPADGGARRDHGRAGVRLRDRRTLPDVSLRWREGAALIQSARRKCLILYYYPGQADKPIGPAWVPLRTSVAYLFRYREAA